MADALDTSEVDKLVGQEVGGGQLKEPITVTDIRRWVQAMNYPVRRHFDEEAAAGTPFGEIVAPQSFTICCDVGHGTVPALVGRIPGSHTVFGGDEWWFYGAHVRPGDLIRVKRRFDGYSTAETKFAGPTMFSRGDTTYINQRKEAIAKQRCTMVRYRADLARERGYFQQMGPAPEFSAEELRDIARSRSEWMRWGQSAEGPGSVSAGDKLPMRPIGPHTIASFTTEYRAFIFGVWGSHYYEGTYFGMDAGWLPELLGDEDDSDASMKVGMDDGPASGHTNLEKAKLIGMPRHYGYGSSIGSWALDYVAAWAGDRGFIRHSKVDYRAPVFEGDLALLHGEVRDQRFEPLLGVRLVTVDIRMVNQDDVVLARGFAEVELPEA
jgi:hypothetical protein